jgi:hypothetical protein
LPKQYKIAKKRVVHFEQEFDDCGDNSQGGDDNNPMVDEEHDKDNNVEISETEMLYLAFTTEVPDNEITCRQRQALSKKAFGYNEVYDQFPDPPRSSTQFTDEKYSMWLWTTTCPSMQRYKSLEQR